MSDLPPDITQNQNRLGGIVLQQPNRVTNSITVSRSIQRSSISQPAAQELSPPIQQNPNHINAEITEAKDAYQLAKERDPTIGTREEWLAALDYANSWLYLKDGWSIPPVFNMDIAGGEVWSYNYGSVTYYRFIPIPYVSSADTFYTTFSSGILSGPIVSRAQTS